MLLVFLIISALAIGLPLLLQPVYFMVADDYLLNYIANGSYGTETSAHLIFIKTFLGRILKLLYGISGNVNWYMLVQAVLLVISFGLITWVIWRHTHDFWLSCAPFLVELFVVKYYFTFTVTGFFTAAAAGALMCVYLEERSGGRESAGGRGQAAALTAFAGSLVLFALAFAMRKDAFLAGTALLCPAMLDAAVCGAAEKGRHGVSGSRVIRRALPALIGFVLVVGAVEALDRYDYSSPAWQDFTRYNKARGDVLDYTLPPYEFMKDILEEQGFTKTDYAMLSGWKFCERSLFSEDRLERLSDRTHEYVTREHRMSYVKSVMTGSNLMLIAIPVLVWLLLVVRKRDLHKLSGLLVLVIDAGLLFVLTWDLMRYVHRVAMPLAAVSVFAMLLCERGRAEKEARFPRYALMAAIIACIFLSGARYLKNYLDTNYYAFRAMVMADAADVRAELRAHPDQLYIIDAGLLSDIYYYDLPVQKLLRTDDFRNVIRSGSWDSYSPRYYSQADRYLDNPDDLLSALVREQNVRFVTTDSSGMKKFLKERAGRKVRADREAFFEGRGVGVIRFS